MAQLGGELVSALAGRAKTGWVPRGLIAFVRAGGKTTAAWRLLNELWEGGERLVFTTTHVLKPTSECVEVILDPDPAAANVDRALSSKRAKLNPGHPLSWRRAWRKARLVSAGSAVLTRLITG